MASSLNESIETELPIVSGVIAFHYAYSDAAERVDRP